MTDALHRCDDCGLADMNVTVRREGKNGYYYMHGDEGDCLAAALRQLAAADALIGRCRPYVEERTEDYSDWASVFPDKAGEYCDKARALLADIDAALGRG